MNRPLLAALIGATALLPAAASAQTPRDAVTILVRNDSVGFDPHRVTGRGAAEILFMMTDTLVALEDDQKTLHPLLARSWSLSPDGLTYTFNLRDDVTFCSGKPLTADDVVYSLKRLVAPETRSPAAWRAGKVKSITAKDAHTVEYVLERPYNELLLQLAQSFGGIIDKDDVEKLGRDFGVRGLNGTGPFCWGEWKPRSEFVLTRHEAYRWGPKPYDNAGPAHVARMIWKVVPEETSIVAAMQTGAGDITYVAPEWSVEQLKKDPRLTVASPRVSNYSAFLGMRVNKEMTGDVRVRQAIVHAINREELMKSLWFGQAKVSDTYVSPGTLDWNGDVPARYDPDAANRLLDEAGWAKGSDGFRYKDGKRLSPLLVAAGTPGWRTRSEAVQGYLKRVGIDLKVLLPEPALAMAQINNSPDYDMYALFAPYGTAGEALMVFHSKGIPAPNRVYWKDAETDALLDAGQVALTDAARAEAYAKVQRKIALNAVTVPLVHEQLYLFSNKRLTGVKVHGIYNSGLYKGLDIKAAAR